MAAAGCGWKHAWHGAQPTPMCYMSLLAMHAHRANRQSNQPAHLGTWWLSRAGRPSPAGEAPATPQ